MGWKEEELKKGNQKVQICSYKCTKDVIYKPNDYSQQCYMTGRKLKTVEIPRILITRTFFYGMDDN